MKCDADDMKKLITQLTYLDVFRVNTALREEDDGDMDSRSGDIPLVSLASKDSAPTDVVSDLLRAEERGKLHVITNVKQRLIEKTVGFYDELKKHRSKTFATLYKATVSTKHNVQKTVKADRKLLQRLLNAVTAGRTVEMRSILKHELSPVPLSLAKHGGDMDSTQKSELINVMADGIPIPSAIPEANMETCVMIDRHGLIQALGKPHWCQTFGDYADVFLNNVTSHFRCHTTRVDVVFDRYTGQQSIKAVTRSKRVGKKRPIRNVPLPQVWSSFIASDENKADLARFLIEIIVTKGLPEQCELVTGGGFSCATHARSTRSEVKLQGNHEEADTRLVLHSCEAVSQGYKRVLVICRDTDVMLLLVHFIPAQTAEVWMIFGIAKKRKCYPIHVLSERLAKPLRDNLMSFHAFRGCDTTSAFSGHGKRFCWKTFQNHPHLVQGIGRHGELAPIGQFVCHLYGTPEQHTVDNARLQLFGKGKLGLEMLPPTRDALELHTARANYQAKIWLQADQEHIDIPSPTDISACMMESDCLKAVWTRLPPIPDARLELVTCGCKAK